MSFSLLQAGLEVEWHSSTGIGFRAGFSFGLISKKIVTEDLNLTSRKKGSGSSPEPPLIRIYMQIPAASWSIVNMLIFDSHEHRFKQ